MSALLLSILASTIIFVVFKLFERFEIDVFQAIVVNYLTACTCGLLGYNGPIVVQHITGSDWFLYTLALGVLFIVVFNLMAMTTQRNGLSVVSVATKMSVVVPIVFGLLYYKESLGIFKGIGIILALVAVYLASLQPKKEDHQRSSLLLPLLVFLGSGVIDTSLKFLEEQFVLENEVPLFSATIFSAAAVVGVLRIGYLKIIGAIRLEFKNVLGGIALGIPNYFSIYFLVKALRSDLLDSSGIFTVNNVAVVMLSTLVGIAFFQERLSLKNWSGIALAIISIVLVSLAFV